MSEIIVEHLQELVEAHAAEILTREEVARLVADLRMRSPVLVDELIPGVMKLGEVHKVLQALLRERVSVRDLETILEVLADGAGQGSPIQLAESVRRRLARGICDSLAGRHRCINALFFSTALEEFLLSSLGADGDGDQLTIEPDVADSLLVNMTEEIARLEDVEPRVVLVCSGAIRPHLRQLVARRLPRLAVLAYEEMTDEYKLEACGTVALETVG